MAQKMEAVSDVDAGYGNEASGVMQVSQEPGGGRREAELSLAFSIRAVNHLVFFGILGSRPVITTSSEPWALLMERADESNGRPRSDRRFLRG